MNISRNILQVCVESCFMFFFFFKEIQFSKAINNVLFTLMKDVEHLSISGSKKKLEEQKNPQSSVFGKRAVVGGR